jgi:hypothetical protein
MSAADCSTIIRPGDALCIAKNDLGNFITKCAIIKGGGSVRDEMEEPLITGDQLEAGGPTEGASFTVSVFMLM